MKSLRPLLNCALGLALLVQGVAFASAPLAFAAPAEQAAAAEQVPCHGDAPAAAVDSAPCACCDGGCVDMGGCAFGHLAAAMPAIRVQLAPVAQAAIALRDRAAESVSLPSRLRPPISVHA